MGRNLSSIARAAVQQPVVRPVVFVELAYDAAPVRLNTDIRAHSFAGKVFDGVGALGGIGAVQEQTEMAVSGLELSLTGLDPALVSLALGEDYQGRPATVWIGFKDENDILIDTPILVFRGLMDTQTLTLGETGDIILTVENKLVDWDRPRILRYNDASQRSRYPLDKGFEFVEQAAERRIVWGQVDKLSG